MHPSRVTLAEALPAALFGPRSAPPWIRFARILISALLIGIGADQVVSAIREWPLHDMDVYLAAAGRIRNGEPLYVAGAAYSTYWYAPWFAVLWVPLSYLPRVAVAIGWSAVLLVATAVICVRLGRIGPSGLLLALLVGPTLFAVSAGGNVQALMLLPLLSWPSQRSGPLWVAMAASLKLTPILLVLVYVRGREWWSALLTVALTAVLVVPGLFVGLLGSQGTLDWGTSILGLSPLLYVVSVGLAAASVFVLPAPIRPLAAATSAVLALPRLFLYDSTLLCVGTLANHRVGGRSAPATDLTRTS